MKKVLFFLFLLFLPVLALAEDNFSLTISDQFINSISGTSGRNLRTTSTEFSLPTKGGSKKLSLAPVEIRSANYESFLSTRSGRIKDTTKVTLYKGNALVASDNFEFYRFALIEDGKSKPYLDGYFYTDNTYYSLKRENTGAEYLVTAMTEADFEKLAAACGAPHISHNSSALFRTSGSATINALKTLEIATDADYEYYIAEGGSGNANANILSILNGVDAIYRSQLNLTLSVVFQNVWTSSSDPYTSTVPTELLTQMRSYWTGNFSNRNYDVAHLFTGRDLDGGVVGIAYISAICGSFKYGLSQRLNSSSYDVALTAHELGHNVGADHDSCSGSDSYIMCPTLVPNANTFSNQSVNTISNLVNQVSCLSTGGGTPTPTPTPSPTPGNRAPVLGSIGPRTVQEDQNLNITLSATDADGDSLTYSVSSTPFGFLSGNSFDFFAPAGTVPSGSSSISYNVTFAVSDGKASDSETIRITLTRKPQPNQAPTFNNPGTQNVNEGQLIRMSLTGSDPEGGPLSILITSGLPAGASYDVQKKILSWKPLGNQSGVYTIGVLVKDQPGLTASDSFNIQVLNVDGVPDMPARHHYGDFDGDGASELALFRNYSGEWYTSNYFSNGYSRNQFGISGDVPVPGDYNGDNVSDFAVYRPSNNTWYLTTSGDRSFVEIQFGSPGDVPVKGADYDGDGRDDLAVFRPAVGSYVYRPLSGSEHSVNIGTRGDIPIPCDFNGDGKDDITVFRPSNGLWISYVNGAFSETAFGGNNDIPIAGDFDGNGVCERIVFRAGLWIGQSGVYETFGNGGDVPVVGDFDGNGTDDFGLWRPSQATWHSNVNSWIPKQFGLFRDFAALEAARNFAMKNSRNGGLVGRGSGLERAFVYHARNKSLISLSAGGISSRRLTLSKGSYVFRGDYDGDTQLDNVFFDKGKWKINYASGATASFVWGYPTDKPVAGDFDGDSKFDLAVYRSGEWHILSSLNGQLLVYNIGTASDTPIPADFNGDGRTDPAVVNLKTMLWQAVDARSNTSFYYEQWGIAGDIPVVADFDADGRADLVAYRPANGMWYIKLSGGNELFVKWGSKSDLPIAGSFITSNGIDLAVFRPSTGQIIVRTLTGQAKVFTSKSARSAQLMDRSTMQSIK